MCARVCVHAWPVAVPIPGRCRMPWGVAQLPAPRQGPRAQRLGSTRERLPSSWSEPPALSGSLGVGGAPPARGTATNSRDALPSLRRDRTALVTGTIPSFSESPQPQGSWAKCHRHAALATPATWGGAVGCRDCAPGTLPSGGSPWASPRPQASWAPRRSYARHHRYSQRRE